MAYETGDRPLGSVVFMHEQDAGGNDLYDGAFVTNITVRSASRAALVAMAMELGSFTAGELSDAVGTRRMRFLLE